MYLAWFLLFSVPTQAADFVVAPDKSYVDIRVYKAGVASALAHNHVMRANKLTGTMAYDPADCGATRMNLVIDAASIAVDPDAVRRRYGMEPLDPDDVDAIRENMESEDQLNVKRYPRMTFTSTGAKATSTGALISGELTIRGVSKAVAVKAKISLDGPRLAGKARLRVRHQDFGFEPYSAMLGAIRNQEKIDLIIVLNAELKTPPAVSTPLAIPGGEVAGPSDRIEGKKRPKGPDTPSVMSRGGSVIP